MDFVVRSVDQGLSDALRWHLEPFVRSRPGPVPSEFWVYVDEADTEIDPPMLSLFLGGDRISRTQDVWRLVDQALWETQQRVLRSVKDYLLFHAGAVGASGGRTLILPAPTATGKSTLVAALLLQGFTYLSDELASLDPITRRMYPYERPIAFDRSSLDLLPELASRVSIPPFDRGDGRLFLRPQDVGAVIGTAGSPIAVVFPSSERGGEPELTPIAAAEAVKELVANSVNLAVYRERGVAFLSEVIQGIERYRLIGGDAQARAGLLRERFLEA
jgi:hypothetical protein